MPIWQLEADAFTLPLGASTIRLPTWPYAREPRRAVVNFGMSIG
jgi:hypothetical protein